MFDEAKVFFANEKISFQIFEGKAEGSRTRSKLAVRGTVERPLIGLFKPGTHDVVEIPNCIEHHEKINEAVLLIKLWMREFKIAPYSEKDHTGYLRYVQLTVERHSGKIQAAFAVNSTIADFPFEKLPFDSIWVNFNPNKTNVIFSADWRLISGKKWMEESIGGVKCYFLPGSFAQSNLGMYELLIQSIQKNVPKHKKIAEFYAGIGIIGLALAKDAQHVILNESNPESKICFEEMLKQGDFKNVSYHLEKAEKMADLFDQVEVAVVDPPRKGLNCEFIQKINDSKVEMLVYVSCGFPSLVRDLKNLKLGGWNISKAEGYVFFPGTPHLETLCFLKRIVN